MVYLIRSQFEDFGLNDWSQNLPSWRRIWMWLVFFIHRNRITALVSMFTVYFLSNLEYDPTQNPALCRLIKSMTHAWWPVQYCGHFWWMVSQLNKVLFGAPWGTQTPALTICSLPPVIPRDPLWLLHCVTPMFVMLRMVRCRKWGSYYDNDKKRVFGSNPLTPPQQVFVMSWVPRGAFDQYLHQVFL